MQLAQACSGTTGAKISPRAMPVANAHCRSNQNVWTMRLTFVIPRCLRVSRKTRLNDSSFHRRGKSPLTTPRAFASAGRSVCVRQTTMVLSESARPTISTPANQTRVSCASRRCARKEHPQAAGVSNSIAHLRRKVLPQRGHQADRIRAAGRWQVDSRDGARGQTDPCCPLRSVPLRDATK